MIPHLKKCLFLLLSGLLFLQGAVVFGKASTCEAAASPYAKIVTPKTKTYIYIRKSKSTSSKKLGKFSHGCGGTILSTSGSWLKIKSGSITGYVKKSSVLSGNALEKYAKENNFPKKVTINVRSLNVREKARKTSDVVTGVKKGETYTVLSETKLWAKIKADGSTGYVLKEYTTLSYKLKNAAKVTSATTSSGTSTSLSSSSALYNKTALCTADKLRIRKTASTSARIIGYMNKKTAATILSKGKEWTKIQSGTIIGYIKNDYYVSGSRVPSQAKKAGLQQNVTLNANMNVRASQSTSSKRIGGASKGSSYLLKKEYKEWASIYYGSKTGYLKKEYLTFGFNFEKATSAGDDSDSSSSSGNATGDKIVSYALQFKGNPYVYGGTSLTEGCDCSGFTMSIYKHFGYEIPRVSRDQAGAGKEVSLDSLQKGDLIFYTNDSGTINHVALYIGDCKVIHASNEKVGIIVSNHTYRTPVKAVRII